nr:cilia- and flagella-associated protein 47-like isoform X2 [Maniola hyperantus]
MSACGSFNPDNVFKQFKVVEFPISFVGLSTTLELDVEVDLNISAYLKTICGGCLMKFNKAYELSASHRAFCITPKDSHTIDITFTPRNECITKARHSKNFDNRFVFDLRVIRVDGSRCCYDEFHSEIGRYYISGQFEDCKVFHTPETLNFGNVIINTKITKFIRIRNESSLMSAKMQYVRVAGFEVSSENFTILPNTSKKIYVTIKPTSLKLKNTIQFKIINPHDTFSQNIGDNFITYVVHFNLKVIYQKSCKQITVIESLHILNEQNAAYTYIGNELSVKRDRKKTAFKYLEISKKSHAIKPTLEKYSTDNEKCHLSSTCILNNKLKKNFCVRLEQSASLYDLFLIRFVPSVIDFGRVGLSTYGKKSLLIQNLTKHDVTISLLKDEYILYTENKMVTYKMQLKSFTEINITIFCHGYIEGNFDGTFEYAINNKCHRKHPYTLQVGNPTLMVNEKSLKFGMVTTESFITSVPIRIYNNFNLSVDFKWDDIHQDTPFEIIPNTGTVPAHSCKICDLLYICKATKTKTHEVNLFSLSTYTKTIPLELSIVTRKLSIKFLQPAVAFKDIALNLETIEKVKLENSSREMALFYVVEPLIPGFTIEPMLGSIRPKMIMSFDIIAKISCILEFAFDICVKINNKENVILTVSGNVVEPKIIIHPRNIYMPRVPCYMITFVPVTFQNISTLKTVVDVLDTGDENIFNVYVAQGNEKKRIFRFTIEGGQSKTVFIKIYDIYRREYEMYIPFKINGLLGPPNNNINSTELKYYIEGYEKSYENNAKVKIKTLTKDISFCRITGVITVPWINFSIDKFVFDFVPNGNNTIDFTITNVSKYYLHVTILTSKLAPNFTLDKHTDEHQSIVTESQIKFELDRGNEASFTVKFHPKGHGKFVSVALLYLNKHNTTPYYNLTFVGKRQAPAMIPDTYRIIFAPCYIGTKVIRILRIKMEGQSEKGLFSCNSKEEPNLTVEILNADTVQEDEDYFTIVTVKISVSCKVCYARNIMLNFQHDNGSGCEVEGAAKSKGINVSYLNFMRRIAGPLMKHVRKISVIGVDESFKYVKEIHDTYREIISLLRSRGAYLWILQAKFLLSYEQFIIYSENVTPKYNADIIFTQELKENVTLFNRLNKQSWFDFILQSYKVFVMDSCFFECICMSSQPRDIVKILIDWYNENIAIQHQKLRGKEKVIKVITNISTDLSDGIAFISVILNYCPFMEEHFRLFCEIDKNYSEGDIINNACLIIEATNLLRLYFPLTSKDFLHPNYLLMLFLSIHLYVTLPMFKPRDIIKFNPPLLRSSSRQVAISPASQETLIFNYIVLNNSKNNFSVEKASSTENDKKLYVSVIYTANFVEQETAILLVHGYNKTRIFDTYMVFLLHGNVGSLNPHRKCKITGPLYRPNKVDILVASPFLVTTVYSLYLTDEEPTIPVCFEGSSGPRFCVKRLCLIDKEMILIGFPKDSGQEIQGHKLHLQIMCLSTEIGNSWIWFRSEVGEFFVRVTTQPRWDLAIDTLQTKVHTWPIEPCSCGDACECYRTTVLMIPHRNELMLKSLRYAILENASELMIQVFDQLIETATGKIILSMLLEEGGTNLSEIQHILRSDTTYRITSRALRPRIERVTLAQHTNAFLTLPVTIPAQDTAEKYSVTFTSECGMDIRTYRVLFIESYSE